MGVITIAEDKKRVDWNAIRAEYIGGGTSYRKLCEKYSVSFEALKVKARQEKWPELRTQAEHKATIEATQKIAEASADNATIAADLKKRLLLRLKRIEENYPQDATEVKTFTEKGTMIFRIRDLTSAYKDLTDDLPKVEADKNAPIYELLRKLDGECGVRSESL